MKKLLSILFFAFMASTVVMAQESSASEASNGENITITVKGVAFTMVFVKGGTFQMGATEEQGGDAFDHEKPIHSVTLSDYYIGETEVTQALWQAVMGQNRSEFKGSNRPVEWVDWNDCQQFITKKSRGYKYSGSNDIGSVAWYDGNSDLTTYPVKQKQANELGIYDMSGNVYEWCQDLYGAYGSSSQTKPLESSSSSYYVYRGGCWGCDARYCRVSYRSGDSYFHEENSLGFRLAL